MKNSLLTGTGMLVSLDFVTGRLCVSLEEWSAVLSSKSLLRLSILVCEGLCSECFLDEDQGCDNHIHAA